MQTFKDKVGFEWKIELLFGDILTLKAESLGKFDLLEPQKDDLAQHLDDDLLLFWELLLHLVESQAAEAGIEEDFGKQFGKRMAGDCLIAARDAFFIEWRDFFRQLQRPEMAAALEAIRTMKLAAIKKVGEKLHEGLKNLPEQFSLKLDQALTKPFSDLQASLASSLTATPIENSGIDTKESPATPAP